MANRSGELRPLISLAEQRLPSFADVPTAKELGIDTTGYTLRGFCVLKGTPEDRVARLEQGLIRAMSGPIYRNYLENTGQAPDSVAGRQVWGAQLDGFHRDGREALQALGLLRG